MTKGTKPKADSAARSAGALIAKYGARRSDQRPVRCPIAAAGPEIAPLVVELRQRKIAFTEISRILLEEFAISTGRDAIGRHLNGQCGCGRG